MCSQHLRCWQRVQDSHGQRQKTDSGHGSQHGFHVHIVTLSLTPMESGFRWREGWQGDLGGCWTHREYTSQLWRLQKPQTFQGVARKPASTLYWKAVLSLLVYLSAGNLPLLQRETLRLFHSVVCLQTFLETASGAKDSQCVWASKMCRNTQDLLRGLSQHREAAGGY